MVIFAEWMEESLIPTSSVCSAVVEGLTATLQWPILSYQPAEYSWANKDYYRLFLRLFPAPESSRRLTGELQSEALLAGEEVRGELHADSVEGAVGVLGHRWATQLSQKDAAVLGSIPDAKHIVDLLRVEHQEVQTVKDTARLY